MPDAGTPHGQGLPWRKSQANTHVDITLKLPGVMTRSSPYAQPRGGPQDPQGKF